MGDAGFVRLGSAAVPARGGPASDLCPPGPREPERWRGLVEAVARFAGGASCVDDALRFALAEVCLRAGWGLGCAYRPAGADPVRLVATSVRHLADGGLGAFLAADGASSFPIGVGLPGRVWDARRPLWAAGADTAGDPGRRAAASICGLRASMAFPVLAAGEVAAVAAFFAREARAPDPLLLDALEEVGRALARAAPAAAPASAPRGDRAAGA